MQDRFSRMVRVLVVLMFAELIIVVLIVDYRLDAVEARAVRSWASANSRGRSRDSSVFVGGAAESDPKTAATGVAAGAAVPPAELAQLKEEDRRAVIEEVYRVERVWRRTAGVLDGLSALRTRQMLRELDRSERTKIVEMTRDYASQRVRMELAVMNSDLPEMDRLREDLAEYDRSEAARIEGELARFLNAAESKQLVRIIVPRGQQ